MTILQQIQKLYHKKAVAEYPFVPYIIDLHYRIDQKNIKKMTVLNVGVGTGDSGIGRQLPYLPFKRLDNIDVFEPYLVRAKNRYYAAAEVFFSAIDIRNCGTSRYDLVMMFDVLEHLPKEDSLAILDRIKCQQLIFIPLEKEFRVNTFEAESQDHLSLWTEQDFKERGYHTDVLKDFHQEGDNIFDALWAWKDKQPERETLAQTYARLGVKFSPAF